nr:MAG TPA: hypothetical protein [Crassvirales sp.]
MVFIQLLRKALIIMIGNYVLLVINSIRRSNL